jgi:hypothetical protein
MKFLNAEDPETALQEEIKQLRALVRDYYDAVQFGATLEDATDADLHHYEERMAALQVRSKALLNLEAEEAGMDEPPIFASFAEAEAALDRGETVHVTMEPFPIDPQLLQRGQDLQDKEQLRHLPPGFFS